MTQNNDNLELHDVSYNARDQMFEALVTHHGIAGRSRNPCRYAAPITAEYEMVAMGLMRAAHSQLGKEPVLRAFLPTQNYTRRTAA